MPLSQMQINMMFGSAPSSALEYLDFLGVNLDYDLESNSIINQANGFRIANLARLDVAQDILSAYREAAANGKNATWFVDYLEPTLKAKGWWNSKELIDPETGEVIDNIIDRGLGCPSRLKLIFENLTNSIYSVARYEQMRKVSQYWPYWRYHAVDDEKTREEHAKLSGKIFRYDDPIWQIIYPPNGHRCRCSIENLTESDIKNGDLVVLQSDSILNQDGRRGVSFIDENGQYVEFYPDAGFDYNPAESFHDINLQDYELDLARQYINESLNGPELEKMYNDTLNGNQTNAQIHAGILSDDEMKAAGLDENTIILHQSTLAHQMQNNTLLPIDDLQQLQTLIINAPVILNYQGAICFCEFTGTYWRIVGVSVGGDVRMVANLTQDAFNLIVSGSQIIKGAL